LSRQLKTLERTIVLQSAVLTKAKADALMYIYRVYGEMLVEALEYTWMSNTTSWTRAKKVLYKKFRENIPISHRTTYTKLFATLLRGLRASRSSRRRG
jgi:hypothetical protein